MSQATFNRSVWPILIVVSAVPRLLGAFFLPNAFGDAYVYILDIGTLSTKISGGAFRLTDLFGFWLPLYQLIAAALNLFVKNGFYSGKLVSAVFGAGTCLFVYALTLTLTQNRRSAMIIFLLIALNPLHIFYSASAMTDVPHAFLVLGALYFVLGKRWIAAAILAALAGMTRVESWMFLALIPLIQIIRERRVSVATLLIMIVPPLFWFYISWKATGDWRACFQQRQQYLKWLLAMNPAIAHFSLVNILRDGATLLVSSDIAVLIACFVAGWLVLRQMPRVFAKPISAEVGALLAPVVFFFAFFSLLLIAYLTHQQPIIFPRYGLILFTIGLPVLAWVFLHLKAQKPHLTKRIVISIAVICLLDAGIQFAGAVGTVNQYQAQRATADYLRDHFDPNSDRRVFCDDGTVRVLSGVPSANFLTSAEAPTDRQEFSSFLGRHNVEYLVSVRSQPPPNRIPPDLGANSNVVEPVAHSISRFLPTDISVYRVISNLRSISAATYPTPPAKRASESTRDLPESSTVYAQCERHPPAQ